MAWCSRRSRFLANLAALLIAMLVLAAPGAAGAWEDNWNWEGRILRDRDLEEDRIRIEEERLRLMERRLRLEEERLKTEEEMWREERRELRREEIEEQRRADSAKREEYFDAILQMSRASLLSPQGAYYRKPGFTSFNDPGGTTVTVDGTNYRYRDGIFWLVEGQRSVVVNAPFGAVVASLPRGAAQIRSRLEELWYYFGVFYRETRDGWEVVPPPVGITVPYLPDGYSQEQVRGADCYRFGGIVFKPVFMQGILVYMVVEG